MNGHRQTALAAACAVLLGFTLAALRDVFAQRDGLGPADALQALLLWALLAVPPALGAGLALPLLVRWTPRLTRHLSARLVVRVATAATLLAAGTAALAPLFGRHGDGALAGAFTRASAPAEAPNIVLLLLDTQRADHLGFMGDRRGLSPNLDRLARQSTVFTRCFATSSWTVPSHASLFTGLYPTTHGASFEHHRHLDERFVTLAEALGARGYETAAFVANDWVQLSNELQGFAHVELLGEAYKEMKLRPLLEVLGFPARFMDHGAADGLSRIERYLGRRGTAARPLFLFINLLEPHWRYLPPLGARLRALPQGMSVLSATRASTEFYGPLAMAGARVDPRTRQAIAAMYAGGVRYQDERIGELLALLDARLGRDDTLLLVTADHGENLGDGGRYDHVFAVNDALIHLPMLARHPKLFPAGRREPGLCSQIDLARTLMEVVPGLALSPSDDARTLLPGRFVPRRHVFVASDPYLGHFERMSSRTGFERDVAQYNATLRAVRDERFKYVQSSRTGGALYDLHADPDELRDVSAAHPERATTLRAELHALFAREPAYRARGSAASAPAASRKSLERLRSLGYAQ